MNEWLLEGWIPKNSFGCILANPGDYKTWLALYLANKCGSSLIIHQTDQYKDLKNKTKKINGTNRGMNIDFMDIDDKLTTIEGYLYYNKYNLLIIDPLYSLINVDEPTEILKIKEWCSKFDLSILFTHHPIKRRITNNKWEAPWLSATLDFGIQIVKEPENTYSIFRWFKGFNTPEKISNIKLHVTEDSFSIEGLGL